MYINITDLEVALMGIYLNNVFLFTERNKVIIKKKPEAKQDKLRVQHEEI